MQAWVVLVGSLLGAAYSGGKLVGWDDRIKGLGVPWLWIGLSMLFIIALFWTLLRGPSADERDLLIQFKSLSFAAQIFIVGVLGVMLFSGGGSEGAVAKPALFCVMGLAAAAAAGRSLYLYRYTA
jgi:hypothetical protein